MKNRFGVVLLAAGLAGVSSAPSWAQSQQTAATEAAQASSGGLEEVVVTAQKRVENVQQVPIAIEGFNEHALDSLQISNIDTLAQFSPGLNINRNIGSAFLSLRGVIFAGLTVGIDPTVAVYVDGTYNPSAAATSMSYNNIVSAEVDKGPQGTLFGRNAVGGVVSITTKDPQQTPHVDANIGYANYNLISGNFYGTTGITDNLAADLAVYAYHQGQGWGKDLYTGQYVDIGKEWTGRTKWVWKDDATRITFIADYDRAWYPMGGSYWLNGINANISPQPTQGPLHYGGFYDVYQDRTPSSQNVQYGVSFKIDHDFGWAEGVSISSWRRDKDKIDNTSIIWIYPNSSLPGTGASSNQLYSSETTAAQEFQLLSPATSPIKWIGGLFLFQDESGEHPFHITFLNFLSPTTYLYDQQNTTSYAAYGQATAPITPDTRVTLGYRYTLDQRSIAGTTWTVSSNGAMGVPTKQATGYEKWPKATYKVALDHDIMENMLAYASYSRGFESGAFNALSGPTVPATNPETLDAYEIGLKSGLLDHKLRVNTSLFYYQFHNLIVSQFIQNPPSTVNVNAAEAQIKGIDLDLQAVITPRLSIQGGLELLDPSYVSFRNAPIFTVATVFSNTQSVGVDTGKQIASTEKIAANMNAQYRIPTDFGDFIVAGDIIYHSGLVFDPQNYYRQNPYFLTNASVAWTAPSGMWDVKVWGKNLNDVLEGTQGPIGTSPAVFQANQPPRTFGINLGYHWN